MTWRQAVSAGAWDDLVQKVRDEVEENEGYALDSGVLGEMLREQIAVTEGDDV